MRFAVLRHSETGLVWIVPVRILLVLSANFARFPRGVGLDLLTKARLFPVSMQLPQVLGTILRTEGRLRILD
jgi:hypothetical protein